MSPIDRTEEIVIPAGLAQRSDAEWVELAERVAQLRDTAAWDDLLFGIRGKQAGIASLLMGLPGSRDRADVAKALGEMSGVGLIEVIATELIEQGEAAAQRIREREEA